MATGDRTAAEPETRQEELAGCHGVATVGPAIHENEDELENGSNRESCRSIFCE